MSHIMDMNMSTDKGMGCWRVLALSKSCNKTWGKKTGNQHSAAHRQREWQPSQAYPYSGALGLELEQGHFISGTQGQGFSVSYFESADKAPLSPHSPSRNGWKVTREE